VDIEELNLRLQNDSSKIDSLKGFEIICESLVYKVLDLFGKNALLSILFQIGAGPGTQISQRIKNLFGKDEFEIFEALEILFSELKDYYAIQIKDIMEDHEKIKIVIENHCFLRTPIKNRERLQFGKAFCRVNKGYFETALKKLLGNKIRRIEIKFLYNDEEKDVCVEELNFYRNILE